MIFLKAIKNQKVETSESVLNCEIRGTNKSLISILKKMPRDEQFSHLPKDMSIVKVNIDQKFKNTEDYVFGGINLVLNDNKVTYEVFVQIMRPSNKYINLKDCYRITSIENYVEAKTLLIEGFNEVCTDFLKAPTQEIEETPAQETAQEIEETPAQETAQDLSNDFLKAYTDVTDFRIVFSWDEMKVKEQVKPLFNLSIDELRKTFKFLKQQIQSCFRDAYFLNTPSEEIFFPKNHAFFINKYDLTQIEKAVLFVVGQKRKRDIIYQMTNKAELL